MRTSRLAALFVFVCVIVGVGGGLDLAVRAEAPQDVNVWASLGALPQARSGAAAVSLDDGRTLIAGGKTPDGTVTDSVVVLDPATNEMTTVGRLLAPRVGHTATLISGGRVLVIGGTTDGAVSSDVEAFDLASGTSSLLASLVQPRTGHAAAALSNGKVLIVGGTTIDGVVLQSAEIFDPETAAVVPAGGSLQVARSEASATTLLDGRVLVAGGNDGTQDLGSAELFDAASESFNLLEPENHLNVPRSGHTAVLLPHNNGVLIAGGRSNGLAVGSADLFVPPVFPDPYTFGVGKFAVTGSMAAARSNATSAAGASVGYALVLGGGPADGERYRFATIQTDRDDYAPGERATITGTGWQAGEDVTLIFQEDPAVHDDYVLHVTADTAGNIYWDQWAPEQHDLNVRFYLTAVDSKSHVQITFTDSQPTAVVLTPTSVSVLAGTDASYQVKMVKGGKDGACTITMSAAYTGTAPIGTSFSFSPNPVNMNTADVFTTLTITTTNSGAQSGRTQPGTYPLAVTAMRGGDCQGNGNLTANGTLIVTAPTTPTTLTAAEATATYGGSTSLSATLASSGTGVSGRTITFTLNGTAVGSATTNASGVATLTGVSVAGINVGSYATAVGASFAGDSVYQASTATSGLTVTKANATVSFAAGTLAQVYDGTVKTVATSTTPAGLTVDVAFTGTPKNAGSYPVTATINDANYQGSASGTLVISKADATVSFVAGTLGQVYDGTVKTVATSTTPAGLTVDVAFTGTPQNAGSYPVTATINDGNYQGSVSGTLVISKADQTITWADPAAITYGTALSATQLNAATSGDGALSYSPVAGTVLNAGTHTLMVIAAETSNYNGASKSVSLVVNKADQTITWADPAAITYGTALSATQLNATTSGDGALSYSPAAGTVLNAGPHTLTVTAAATSNYNEASKSVSLVVDKADATITVNGYTGIYDGNAHGATGSAKGVQGEDLNSLLNLGDSFTNVPGGTATWAFAGDGNYKTAGGSVAIAISKANASITVNGYTGVYDGNAHSASGHVTGVKGEDLTSLLNIVGSFTDVPGGTATWSFAGNENYNAATGTAPIVISKANQVIVWANPSPIVYGTALSGAQLNATLAQGDGALTYSPAAGTILPVGSQTLQVTAAATTNYYAATAQVTLQVTPWYATGFYKPVTMGGVSVVNTVKGGSTVPLKFNLYTSVNGTELIGIDSIAGFQVYPMSCGATTYEDPIDFITTGGTSLRYDSIERQFIQNWQTPKGAGACYKVTMTAKDGTSLIAFFKTK